MDAVSYGLLVEVKHKVLFMITTDRDADLTFDEYLQVCERITVVRKSVILVYQSLITTTTCNTQMVWRSNLSALVPVRASHNLLL